MNQLKVPPKSLMLGLGLVEAVWGIPKVAPYFYNPGGDLSIRTSCFDLEPETPYNSEYSGGEISVQLVSKHPDRIQPTKYFAVVIDQNSHDAELVRLDKGQVYLAITGQFGGVINWNGPRTQVSIEPPSLHEIDLYAANPADVADSITSSNRVASKVLTNLDSCHQAILI